MSSAPVERQADATRERSPHHGQQTPIIAGQFRRGNAEPAVGVDRDIKRVIQQPVEVAPPAAGSLSRVQQRGVDAWRNPPKRRQEVVPDPVPQGRGSGIARIVDPLDAATPGVSGERRASQRNERPDDGRGGQQAGQPTRTGAAQFAQQYGLDLIALGVRRCDARPEGRGALRQKCVACAPPRCLPPFPRSRRVIQAAHHHGEAQPAGGPRDVRGRIDGGGARSMIECGDGRDTPARDSRHGVQQRHGVEPAGNGEQQRRVDVTRRTTRRLVDGGHRVVVHGWKYNPRECAIFPLVPLSPHGYLARVAQDITVTGAIPLETHGPLGTIWVGLGLCGFYIGLVWINSLLGFVLTPLFIVPLTWLQDRLRGKNPARG